MAAASRRLGSRTAVLALLICANTAAHAGGPLLVRSNGIPYAWSTAAPISYRTDNGPLSATVNEAAARARVAGMFNVWQSVATSSIAYSRAGFINPVGAFTGGDVNTLAEFNAVAGDCSAGNQSPVIYDANASMMIGLGFDESSVIGFAGPCAVNQANYRSGLVVMNGLFQDGASSPVPDIPSAAFDAALVHEIGHFSGLDHSQVNVNCLSGCNADDLAGLPTMFPFLVDVSQLSLSPDDIAWISRLHPQTSGGSTFAGTHGTITGIVFFSDGESHAQLVNVIARQVNTGGNQHRRVAVSVISGYKFRVFHGNALVAPNDIGPGSEAPGDIGLFEIPVPAGSYTVQAEPINPLFVDGSSIGPGLFIPIPGTPPAPSGPVAVASGATSSGHQIILLGTAPRFDQFEGP